MTFWFSLILLRQIFATVQMNFRLFFPKAKTDSEKQYTVRTKNTTVSFLKMENAVANISDGYALKHEDKQLLCSFGEKLGITDVEGQLKHIELYKGLANAHLDDSKNEIKQKSRLYKTMGFFVGTAAALVII